MSTSHTARGLTQEALVEALPALGLTMGRNAQGRMAMKARIAAHFGVRLVNEEVSAE